MIIDYRNLMNELYKKYNSNEGLDKKETRTLIKLEEWYDNDENFLEREIL